MIIFISFSSITFNSALTCCHVRYTVIWRFIQVYHLSCFYFLPSVDIRQFLSISNIQCTHMRVTDFNCLPIFSYQDFNYVMEWSNLHPASLVGTASRDSVTLADPSEGLSYNLGNIVVSKLRKNERYNINGDV